MSILHVESIENCGDEGLLAKTDAFIMAVDIDAEELLCWTGVHDLESFREFRLKPPSLLWRQTPYVHTSRRCHRHTGG